jgi:hypothetical protein
MDRETILRLIAEWREQSEYCWSIDDHGGGRAWAAAADKLEEELDA